MNLIERLVTLDRIATAYGAHSDLGLVSVVSPGSRVVYTLPVHPASAAAQELANSFYREALNWGAATPDQIETRANVVTVTL